MAAVASHHIFSSVRLSNAWILATLSASARAVCRKLSLPIAIDTPHGQMFPCLGVYTIDGRACGIYGRLSPRPVITYEAIDIAVLIDQKGRE